MFPVPWNPWGASYVPSPPPPQATNFTILITSSQGPYISATLYEHQQAKSTFQSWSLSSTFPAAWAKSQPTTQPCYFNKKNNNNNNNNYWPFLYQRPIIYLEQTWANIVSSGAASTLQCISSVAEWLYSKGGREGGAGVVGWVVVVKRRVISKVVWGKGRGNA